MPSKPKPKTFVAVRDFSVAGDHYATGDEVPPGRTLRTALRHGDMFVTDRKPNTPTPTPESKETSPS